MCSKATFWGMTCDVIGRRLAWNATLVISGVFGVACVPPIDANTTLTFHRAGASPNFVTLGGG